MRILLIASAYNGLCQRVHVELVDRGYEVSITLSLGDDAVRKAIALFQPDLIICPFLKEKLPEDVWREHLCIILHPGIMGDRGPSSLDWAIMRQESEWGVTALKAVEEMDAGDIWSTLNFPMREATKASLYRREVTRAAVQAILTTIDRFASKAYTPEPLDYSREDVRGELRPLMKQDVRAIDWSTDTVATIIRKINAADSAPGVLDMLYGEEYFLYGAHAEDVLRGRRPGEVIAQRHGAICRAAVDGAVWISHLRKRDTPEKQPFLKRLIQSRKTPTFKLPAAMLLGDKLAVIKESPIDLPYMGKEQTYCEIWYEESNKVGYLHFNFHNGAMGTEQCQRLQQAYLAVRSRDIKVLVLMGGTDFWSNGIHLNWIEAADDPARESWRNINAIDDVVREIITTDSLLTVSAIAGSAGAGGVMMTLAADQVWARKGVILNPHYKTMGLYGSEYWTYLLPKRVGPGRALELTETPLPLGMKKAKAIGLVDEVLPEETGAYQAEVRKMAEALAASSDYQELLEKKRAQRAHDEAIKPLESYRAAELQHMRANFAGQFYGGDVNYHEARYNFVHKIRPKETACYLAQHLKLDFARLSELRQPLAY
ncbi:enoyl-CoA hydratase-related protein [Methyloterricola oryzae]|uniref:enoyl-CoA hydratase-related protein n=1 Tax=Methyloterricola oryzae TaxID=1495050 RepID=UPI0005EB5F89|nr:enoyl-CoA hydratase-related protein [Methyloterricola oryzae]